MQTIQRLALSFTVWNLVLIGLLLLWHKKVLLYCCWYNSILIALVVCICFVRFSRKTIRNYYSSLFPFLQRRYDLIALLDFLIHYAPFFFLTVLVTIHWKESITVKTQGLFFTALILFLYGTITYSKLPVIYFPFSSK
jgi:hypothetical protein